MTQKRTAFFISDRTGITAEMLGRSLLTQFDQMEFEERTLPFVDSVDLAQRAAAQIEEAAKRDGARPLVFSTLVDSSLSSIITATSALYLDCFQFFIATMETELGVKSSQSVGKSHSAADVTQYYSRIDAVNFTLTHDDGSSTRELAGSDIILVGVSRCGKTPTSLYLAMQFGIRAANYPLIPEDFEARRLPAQLQSLKSKLFGLTIRADRLQRVRQERRPGSRYATLENCQHEIREAETMMRNEAIPYLDTTSRSIEEIATTILQQAKLQRHIY
jgi:regulator of PEP synthase PpsR (kinase-PPPase family)